MKSQDKYMEISEVVASMSYCERGQVGAVLVRDNRIISTGVNGTVDGADNCCEMPCNVCNGTGEVEEIDTRITRTCPRCQGDGKITNGFTVHAEQNLITTCAKNGISTNNATLYVTMSPCPTCANLIVQSGIKKVIYKSKYKDTSGVQLMKSVGLEVIHYDDLINL